MQDEPEFRTEYKEIAEKLEDFVVSLLGSKNLFSSSYFIHSMD